jgi:peptide deformylase
MSARVIEGPPESNVQDIKPVYEVEGVTYSHEELSRRNRKKWIEKQVFLIPRFQVIRNPLDPRLYAPNKKVRVDPYDLTLVEESKTLAGQHIIEGGAGLAAPQIGLNKRMFAMTLPNGAVGVLFNPRIVGIADLAVDDPEAVEFGWEGCISHPGVWIECARLKKVDIIAQTLHQPKPSKYTFSGFLARVVQHEIQHLEGSLITDLPENLVRSRRTDEQGQTLLFEENRKAAEHGFAEAEV